MATPAQLKASQKYMDTLDDIKIRVPKGKRDEYKAQAEIQGFKSLNTYVIHLIEKDKERI